MQIFFLILNLGYFIVNHHLSEDTISWKRDYRLKWSDFQGTPDSSSKYAAITKVTVRYSLKYTDTSYSYTVECFFNKKLSWILDTSDLRVLEHENGHFDIAEIFARKLRKRFKEYKFKPQTISSDFKKIYTDLKNEDRALDSLYDKETGNYKKFANQRRWNSIIANELKKLHVYSTDNMK